MVNLTNLNIGFNTILTIFELVLIDNVTPNFKISPHFIDFSRGFIRFENHIDNCDLVVLLSVLKSKVPIQRVECLGLRSPNLEDLIIIFEILSINQSLIDLDVSPHIIDLSSCSIDYQTNIDVNDLLTLLTALKSNVPIKRVLFSGLQNPSFEELPLIFEILSLNKSVIELDISHFFKVYTDVFWFLAHSTEHNPVNVSVLSWLLEYFGINKLFLFECYFPDNVITVLRHLLSNSKLLTSVDFSRCKFSNEYGSTSNTAFNISSDSHLKSLITLFDLFATHQSIKSISLDVFIINFDSKLITYNHWISNRDLNSLLDALKSNLPIKRVECCRLKSPSLRGLATLFQILSINRSVIDVDVAPHSINIEHGVFRYLPESCTHLTVEEVSSLRSLLRCFNIKELTIKNCSFTDESVTVLCNFIRINNTLTSIDFNDCNLSDDVVEGLNKAVIDSDVAKSSAVCYSLANI
ncbi:hypothetical protein GEMRC1_009909 [Eukaryota sp. GEM-RC1]